MTTGSLAGSPWRFKKNYEPIRPPKIQDMGPPSPCRLPLKPTVGRQPDLDLHEESRGRAGFKKPATRRPTPRSRLPRRGQDRTLEARAHITAMGRGVATVKLATPETRSTPGTVRRTG